MALRWHWLLVVLAAVTVACLVPGSMVAAPPSAFHTAESGTTVSTPSGIECAATACTPASPTAPATGPGLTLAATLAAGVLFVPVACAIRRRRAAKGTLPAGRPFLLLRPPQLTFSV